jgi:hypothetical protein
MTRRCQHPYDVLRHCVIDPSCLQVGRLELPPELLQSGPVGSPYLSTWSISTVGTGAGVIKSRNNLLRAAQTAA